MVHVKSGDQFCDYWSEIVSQPSEVRSIICFEVICLYHGIKFQSNFENTFPVSLRGLLSLDENICDLSRLFLLMVIDIYGAQLPNISLLLVLIQGSVPLWASRCV